MRLAVSTPQEKESLIGWLSQRLSLDVDSFDSTIINDELLENVSKFL